MTVAVARWAPPTLLVVGAVITVGIDGQRSLPLRVPIDSVVPAVLLGVPGTDMPISDAERQVAGMSSYLARAYSAQGALAFTLYIGYYARQTQGTTIHSPKNCLPGAGWEPLAAGTATVNTARGPVTVNRYLLQNGTDRALVLYWYQGRGRVASSEYRVKWDLLRDAALKRRTDEALVRIVVPITATEDDALTRARRAAELVVPALYRALPP